MHTAPLCVHSFDRVNEFIHVQQHDVHMIANPGKSRFATSCIVAHVFASLTFSHDDSTDGHQMSTHSQTHMLYTYSMVCVNRGFFLNTFHLRTFSQQYCRGLNIRLSAYKDFIYFSPGLSVDCPVSGQTIYH